MRVDPPKGKDDEHGVVWHLKRWCSSQEYVIRAMVKIGFTVVSVAAQTFYHAGWLLLATVHDDHFIAASETQSLDVLDEALEKFFVLKKMSSIGPPEFGGNSEG